MELFVGIVVTVILALLGIVWKQFRDEVASIRRECEKRDEALWDQVGRDGEHGMRKITHAVRELPSKFMELDRDYESLRDRVTRLER